MAFSSIFKRASSLLGFTSPTNLKPPPLDGEIIYCKNNVCVHPPATLTSDKEEHHQGYLTLRSTHDKVMGPSLVLTWIPNSTLRKNTKSIENSPNRSHRSTPKASPRRTPRQEFAKPDNCVTTPTTCMTDLSPLDSCVSVGSDLADRNRNKTRSSFDSNIDEISLSSKAESVSSSCLDDERKNGADETNAGIEPDTLEANDDIIQNNEKCISNINKERKVGQNVNDLHVDEESKCDIDRNCKSNISSDRNLNGTGDSCKLSAANQNDVSYVAKQRNSSSKSVSIEMDGDNLCITTEELDDDVLNDTQSESSDKHTDKLMENNVNNGDADGKEVNDGSDSGADTKSNDTYFTISPQSLTNQSVPAHPDSLNLSAINSTAVSPTVDNNIINTPDIFVGRRLRSSSSSSTTTSGPDSDPPSPYSSSPSSLQHEPVIYLDTPSSPESFSQNLQFPENSVGTKKDRDKKSAKEQVCGVFSVDLGQMRSLRVFYSDPEYTIGQIVIASRESQYKILHFHHGGLDKLAEIFQDWSLFATSHDKLNETEKHYKQFMIVKPSLTEDQCHPEEGVYSMVTEDIWRTHMMDDGIIEDDYQLRKAVFFGGLEPCLRHEVWPFLLHYYPFDSTFEEREQIRNDRYIEYQNIRKKRESMTEEEHEVFWRNVQCTVEKDAVRTDRSHPYFKGDNNPNIEVLKNILLNYAVANPRFGYTQGMSDLLAPVLAEIQKEVDAFWCFTGLMQKTIFVSSPKDCDMDKQLLYLRELLRLMQPVFYEHLKHLGDDAMELLFAHRWVLLCFKREFNEKAALRIWESCWSHHQTDYFHLFICVAIVGIYGEDVVEQCLPADEILLHFSSLACHMSGELVLRKARGLLHAYRKLPVIPCTLHGLCSQCGQGMWDSGHVPTVECVGNHLNADCPYLSPVNSPDHDSFDN